MRSLKGRARVDVGLGDVGLSDVGLSDVGPGQVAAKEKDADPERAVDLAKDEDLEKDRVNDEGRAAATSSNG